MAATKTLFRKIFEQNNIYGAPSQMALARAITACFDLPNICLTVEEKAVAIVEALYDITLTVDKDEQTTIVTELLYTIYYEPMVASEDVPLLLLQIAAAKGCHKTVQRSLEGMSLQERLRLIAFLFRHYREGSWPLLGMLQKQADPHINELIDSLMQNYFSLEHFQEGIKKDDLNLEALVDSLSSQAKSEAKACFARLSALIPQVYSAMLKVYEQVGKHDAKIAQHKAQFLDTFDSYFAKPFTLEEFLAFARLFGLRAYPLIFATKPDEPAALEKKLALCTQEVVQQNAALVHSFLSAIMCHILAMREQKTLGLDLVTCSIATSGKYLRTLAGLESILEGYRRIGARLLDHPIFVFDQSNSELLTQNRRYIDELNKAYKSAVVSISKEEARMLAKRLNIEGLINTTKSAFGYGGARNCQYLLTGVLKAAFSCGIQSIDGVLAQDNTTLFSFFKANVLSSKMSLLMVDDDMQLAAGSIFSSALLAKQISSCYSSACGIQYGRETKTVYGIADLAGLLQGTKSPFAQWSDALTPSGIAEYTCKPKICINIPHGCEEGHLWLSCKTHFYLQPARHLSGSGYPSTKIPTSPLIGVQEYIKTSLTHDLLIGMVSTLVDPQNSFGVCMLPWNDAAYHDTIGCLQDALEVIGSHTTQKELIRRFLRNIRQFFGNANQNAYYTTIQQLMQLDAQDDVRYFWHFGQTLAQVDSDDALAATIDKAYDQNLASYPLYQGFYQLSCSLGKGEFCEAVRHMQINQ